MRHLSPITLLSFALLFVGFAANIEVARAAEAAAGSDEDDAAVQLIVEDGQLQSHPFLVFVTHKITPEMKPRLMLKGAHLILPATALESGMLPPLHVVPDQLRTIEVAGQSVTARGTLLIFDLSRYKIHWFKSGVRLLPLVQWTEGGAEGVKMEAVAENEIFLGNMIGATIWTGAAVIALLATLLFWSQTKSEKITAFTPRPLLLLITGPDGYLSLWRAQLLLWTFAVGGLVFLFGLVRLRVPEIPETLVALMGMSLLTGGLSATQARKDEKGRMTKARARVQAAKELAVAVPAEGEKARGTWADLIASWNDATAQVELSVPKAQMVIWTVLILGLFIVKSILEGALWSIPWQMVALTGVSQAGYIGDKFMKSMVPVER